MQRTCPKGHSYDDQKTTYCPECPIEGLDPAELSTRSSPPPRGSWSRSAAPNFGSDAGTPRHKKTVAIYPGLGSARERPTDKIDPVVGWLVAHEGPALGRDFRIRWGNNAIGRGDDMPIAISEDEQIHGRDHAFIVFDPKTNKFLLRAGTQKGLVHVNDELVTQSVELTPYSTIEIGQSKLIFVPLCREDAFVWKLGKDESVDKP